MLQKLDRIVLVVPDLEAAADTFGAVLGTATGERDRVPHLGANRLVLGLPDSELELLAPTGEGVAQAFCSRFGAGLFGVGFASARLPELRGSVAREGIPVVEHDGALWCGPTRLGGLHVVLSDEKRPRRSAAGEGLVDHIYEVTNPVADEPATTAAYVRAFGLDASRFAPIASKAFGYTGTLTLLDPPARLDRIEVTQTHDPNAAMDRFYRRRGEGLYMCFGETTRLDALRARLDALHARYDGGMPGVLFIHPKSLCGMLMGVSAEGVAWQWSTGAAH